MKFVSSPQFCAIAPINYLHLVEGNAAHLCLAHLVEKSDVYAEFMKNEAANGSFIIMDNSAYERLELGPYNPDELMALAQKCGAKAIVLPDYIFTESAKTIAAAEQYAPLFKAADFATFFVPQSRTGDVEDWIAAYDWAANGAGAELIDIIGISILGVPNAWSNIEPSFARVVAMQTLVDRGVFNTSKHHHFLGLNAGPALEIPSLLRMGVLDTIDSSGPVFAGMNGHRYSVDSDSYQAVRKLTMPVDFFAPLTKDSSTIDRIHHNLQLTYGLFTNFSTVNPWYAVE